MQLQDVIHYTQKLYPEFASLAPSWIQHYAPILASVIIPVEKGISAVKAASGYTVWAHPFSGYHSLQKELLSTNDVLAIFNGLLAFGIDGLEADYLSFSPEQRNYLHQLAFRENLICTAGSDFHGFEGRNKMGVVKV